MALVLLDLTLVTMNDDREVVQGDLTIDGGKIVSVGSSSPTDDDEVIDMAGLIAVPGFVQAHVHLCQTLFRNLADDLSLLDWLQKKIWPFEAAHDDASLYASARLGIAELLNGGTTAVLDMGTVRHTDAVFRAADEMGLRATIGKTIMDRPDPAVPAALRETAADALKESEALAASWHGKATGRLRYGYAPRFVVSCTEEAMAGSAERARELGTPLHTHASENKQEIELVRKLTGKGNIEYLDHIGALSAPATLAHCVHVDAADIERIKSAGSTVTHCPSSNLKLASGLAPVPQMLEAGLRVALGADGAPCNNNLDAFQEMRLAALIHKPGAGEAAMPAAQVLEMMTRNGAEALGLGAEIGSIEPEKRADITILDLNGVHTSGGDDPVARIVYSARATDVDSVLVAGTFVKRAGELLVADTKEIRAQAAEQLDALRRRMS